MHTQAHMGKRMNMAKTKLAVRTVVAGYRSANRTAKAVGGEHGDEITAHAKRRAGEILDDISEDGTDAAVERRDARREVES